MSQDKSQETVFISGATSGLGSEIAEHFVKIGKSVVFCARSEGSVNATDKHLKSLAAKNQVILGFSNDVSNRDTTIKMFEKLQELNIHIDILICNAGLIGPIDRFIEINHQDWELAFNVNFYGTMNLVMQVLPSMISQKKGKVIHISGGGATSPLYGMSSYAASKAAAVRLIETLAIEYEDSGVTFNSLAPGMLKTKLLDQMLDAGPDRIGRNLFTKSLAKAESPTDSTPQTINLINFLASDASIGITGKLISAEWDNWAEWPSHLHEIKNSDVYTLRRITGRDRDQEWGDL
jgi:NAD(P)-dependent dehydrogenase (short-subunit alcohol dehydrogenase family)